MHAPFQQKSYNQKNLTLKAKAIVVIQMYFYREFR